MRVGTKNKTTDSRFCATIALSLIALAGLQPPVFMVSKDRLLLLLSYHGLPSVDNIFTCPGRNTLITVAKTLIIANPGCSPWTSQANNYSPNRKCPSDSPPSERSWVCDSPLFSSLQAQLREFILQWLPKTRVSAPARPTGPRLTKVMWLGLISCRGTSLQHHCSDILFHCFFIALPQTSAITYCFPMVRADST